MTVDELAQRKDKFSVALRILLLSTNVLIIGINLVYDPM